MMAQMNLPADLPAEKTDLDGRRSVNDPCCGSGRMLLAAAEIQPNWHFVGQDVDLRCVRMTAVNLALRNHYGHIVLGNALTNTTELIYETGRVKVWGNAIRKVTRVPLPNLDSDEIHPSPTSPSDSPYVQPVPPENEVEDRTSSQLRLF